ncbi:helix-turn-helix domain-containing protein [Dactylosporangium roseum]|uniref:Helix-turn-helix domain-containing protein n=1 Tax=Dactylosporangium roseum TaxID=47989 RepID=A0ABY5Z781_9ACTN|nr:helix-turn-helix domain-containing protein [Dactylosporangium roseum]UWZ36588.1 helix-turn-helix domain-containing protein [Dactylosporangium roseum]
MRPGPSGETIDTPRHRALGSANRVAILRLVRASEAGLTGAEVVERTGLHPSTVRVHLERLVEAGLLVKARASGGAPGRPAWRYRGAAAEPAPAPYRTLAAALLEHLAGAGGGAPAAAAAGQAWGRRLATTVAGSAGNSAEPATVVVDVLTQLGFDPQPAPSPSAPPGDGTPPGDTAVEVHLRTCPFLDLVGQHPDVMCGLHAGMISGVLHTAGAPDGQSVLEPFGAPAACVVRLRLPDPTVPGDRP